jgi:hypothetical protein
VIDSKGSGGGGKLLHHPPWAIIMFSTLSAIFEAPHAQKSWKKNEKVVKNR